MTKKITKTAKPIENIQNAQHQKQNVQQSKRSERPRNKKAEKNDVFQLITKYGYIIIIALAIVVYGRTISFNFVGLDDKPIIINNYSTIGSLSNIPTAFKTDAFLRDQGNFYRPLQTVSFMIDAAIGGKNPFIYHLTNLLLHCLICCTIYWLLITIRINKLSGLLATMIFTVHPLLTHAVSWIPARNDLLITLFCILAFISFVNFYKSHNWLYYVFHIICITLAIFSKETALTFPALCLLYVVYIEKKPAISKDNIIFVISWIVIFGFWALIRQNTIGFVWGKNEFGFGVLIKNILIVPEILAKFTVPYRITVLSTFNTITSIVGIAVIILCTLLIILKKEKRMSYMIFGIAWFLLMIIPGSLYRHSYADYFYDYLDHRAYLPMVGILILLIELFPKEWFIQKNKLMLTISSVIILILGGLAFAQSSNYVNRLAFRAKAARDDPQKAGFRLAYGKALKEEGRIDEAEKEFLDGIKEMPQEQDFYMQLGEIYFNKKQFDKTLFYLNNGIKVNPKVSENYNNLGGTYFSLGRNEEALRAWSKAVELDSNNESSLNDVIRAYTALKKYDSALIVANIMKNRGKTPKTLDNLYIAMGNEYYVKGNPAMAIEVTEKALSLGKNNLVIYNNLGTYYVGIGNQSKAIEMWKKALSLNPNYLDAYVNLYRFYLLIQKKPELAAPYAKEVLKRGRQLPSQDINALRSYLK